MSISSSLLPHQETPPPVQQILAPLHANLTQTRALEQQAQGTDSLRSSDEFPANKENSHGRWHQPAAPAVKAVATAGVNAAHLLSEQVLAQEAVFALQVKPLHGSKHVDSGKFTSRCYHSRCSIWSSAAREPKSSSHVEGGHSHTV